MIIVLRKDATAEQIDHVVDRIKEIGLKPHVSSGSERTIIGAIGDESLLRNQPLEAIPGVENVMPVLKPYKLASAESRPERTVVPIPRINGQPPLLIGGPEIVMMGGPCSVENREILQSTAITVRESGAHILRAGAFKPRTSPYSFQGLGEEGLKLLVEARDLTGLPFITEVMDPRDVDLVAGVADIIQIGARNMQNFNLLKVVGRTKVPVMIKRGLSSTIEELLMSAEYVLSQGNSNVILCERGIRTFETMTRNTVDISAVPALHHESHLPVVVDPSHGTGRREFIGPVARGAVAAGADGIMVEFHPMPEKALSDGQQALLPPEFAALMKELDRVARSIDRYLLEPKP